MIDLVEQARNPDAGAYDSPARYAAYLEGLCQELADEVERLRLSHLETEKELERLRGEMP